MIRKSFAPLLAAAALAAGTGYLTAAEETDAKEPVAVNEEVAVEQEGTQLVVTLPAAPRSLQTLVDERRDALRERRRQRFDLISGRYVHSPWMLAHREAVDGYSRTIRALHRRQRDAMKALHDSRRRFHDPYSTVLRDLNEQHNYAVQMAQLDHQEAFDNLIANRPFAAGPFVYPW